MGYFGVDYICVLLVITIANVACWVMCQARRELWSNGRMPLSIAFIFVDVGHRQHPVLEAGTLRHGDLSLWSWIWISWALYTGFYWRVNFDSLSMIGCERPGGRRPAGLSRSPVISLEGNKEQQSVSPASHWLHTSPKPPDSELWLRVVFCVARELLQLSS